MQLAVERLADDRRFAQRFRRDPDAALRRYRLTASQVDAIKSGDARALAVEGVDVAALASGRPRTLRARGRRLAAAAAMVGAGLGLAAAPAGAARWGARRMGARMDGIWNLGHASEQSGHDLRSRVDHVQVPTDGAPGQGRPFHLDG